MEDSDSASEPEEGRTARQSVPNDIVPNSLSAALLLTLRARGDKQERRSEQREAAFRELAKGVERRGARVSDLAAKSERHTILLDRRFAKADDAATQINQLGVDSIVQKIERAAGIRSLMHYIETQAFILLILATGLIA